MKKPKIKNPVARWFAGFGVILVGITVGGGMLRGIFYGIGRLTMLNWAKTSLFGPPPYLSLDIEAAGLMTLMVILIGLVILGAIYGAGQWTGNTLFNHSATTSPEKTE